MITEPTEFTNFKNRKGELNGSILRLYDGTSFWFFGDVEIEIDNNSTDPVDTSTYHVYSIMSYNGISQSIDESKKTWTAVRVNITLLDIPYRINTSGDRVKPSDDLKDLKTASQSDIFLVAGPNVTSLDDCLHRFHGVVLGSLTVEYDKLKMTLVDRSWLYRKSLPYTIVGDIYPTAPDEFKNEYIPIVYGQFNQDYASPLTHNGLARGVRIQDEPPKWVFADHQGKEITKLFMGTENTGTYLFEADSATLNANDSGRVTGQQNAVDNAYRGIANFSINNIVDSGIYYNRTNFPVTNPENSFDDTVGTKATLQDEYDDGTLQAAGAAWGIADASTLLKIIKDQENDAVILIRFRDVDYVPSSISFLLQRIGFNFGSNNSYPNSVWLDFNHEDYGDSNWREMGPYAQDLFAGALIDKDLHVCLYFVVYGGDSVESNEDLFQIDELSIRLQSTVKLFTAGYAEMKGRDSEYGYEYTDIVIMSILEDLCGVESDYIDLLNNFQAAHDTNIACRLNLHSGNRISSDEVIRTICEQSTHAFAWTSLSMPKCIKVTVGAGVAIDKKIFWANVVLDSVKAYYSDVVANKITVFSRWQEDLHKYQDENLYEDLSSQADYGIRPITFRWKNINGTSASYVANQILNLLAEPHLTIEFESDGFELSSLEIGDVIAIDNVSFDPHFKPFDISWSNKGFLVTDLMQKQTSIRVKAVHLFVVSS